MNTRVSRLFASSLAVTAMPLLGGCWGLTALSFVGAMAGGGSFGSSSNMLQDIQVTVAGPPTADCVLSNELEQWTMRAPGTARIKERSSDLTVSCRQSGYEPATVRVPHGRWDYPDSVHITLAPLCSADDAACLAARAAEAEQRAAEEAAAAEAARAAVRATLSKPDASATEKEAAVAEEQRRLNAWYAGNQDALRDAVNRVVREERLLIGCAANTAPTRPVSIAQVQVTGVQAGGQVASITYTKHVDGAGCDETRTDSFLLRIVNDVLLEVDFLGPAAAKS